MIHQLLAFVFSGQAFENFATEHFPDEAAGFTSEMSRDQKIQHLVESVAANGQLKKLLDVIEADKPDAYQTFVQRTQRKRSSAPMTTQTTPTRSPRSVRTNSEIMDTKNNLLLNEELASRYRLDDVLDRSGLGAIFKAYDNKLGIDVAIKVIDLNRVDEPALVERVQQEVRTAIKLDHPSIVKIYDYGQVGQMLYIIMEYIPGYDLDKARQSFKHVPLNQLLKLGRQLCLTVDYLHQHGVLHPGTKPKNIMLKPDKMDNGSTWHPVFINLGFLRPNQEVIKSGNVSVRRLIYQVSPELLLGHRTDLRSDVYTMGVLLYDILCGQPPFWPPNLEDALNMHVEMQPPAPRSLNPNLPEAVEQVLLRALAKDPAERYLSLKGMAQDLAECIDGLTLPDKQAKVQRPALPMTDLMVSLDGRPQTVKAGESAIYRILLYNNGTQDDARHIRVDGIPAEWVTVSPSTAVLSPQERKEVEIDIQPPWSPHSRAGRRALTIQAVNQHDPAQVEEIKTVLTLAPFYQFEATMWPQELSGEQTTQVTVENLGNTVENFTLQPKEDNRLKFQPTREQLKLDVGEKGTVDFKVAPRRRYLVGDSQTRTFTIVVSSTNQQTATQSGQITSNGQLPVRWALISLLALLLCSCAVLVLYLQIPGLLGVQAGIIEGTSTAASEASASRATREMAATATAIMATATWMDEDSDRDGLTNREELEANTDPTNYDTDGDTLPDGAELNELNTSPLRPDTDFDGVRDDVEVVNVWDPENRDTDLDGTPDAFDDSPDQPPTVTPETTPVPDSANIQVGFSESQPFLTRIFLSSPPRYRVNENNGRVLIEVSLDQPADRIVQVNYHIINSTAEQGQDYNFTPGTLEFERGEREAYIELSIIDDSQGESEEVIIVGLREPSANVFIGTSRIELQIEDND
ncbi:MAG: protein kinase [Anaerolineae bacterium]|nr:protein kinase [Anaerolineae bacterium]